MRTLMILVALTLVARAALAADPNTPDPQKAAGPAPDVAKTLLPSLVRVEITTHYDRGEVPHGGAAWPGTHNDVGYETLIKEERPAPRRRLFADQGCLDRRRARREL